MTVVRAESHNPSTHLPKRRAASYTAPVIEMDPDPSRTPAMEPPPGVESNLDNPETLQPTRIALSAVCITLCVVFITARSYARAVLLNKFDLDDCKSIDTLRDNISWLSRL